MIKPLVSITVPIYKTEKYLPRCVDSLIAQSLENIEIILVNDGSPDNSGKICDEYAAKDSRIKVIHKVNGGSASARQTGLDASTGEFYTVCDSDDWVEPNMYKELYDKAKENNADIILSRFYSNYPDGREKISAEYAFVSQQHYIQDLIARKIEPSTCFKLINTDTIKNNNISYEQHINLGEDALFLFKLLLRPLKIVYTSNAYYHYQRDKNSTSYTNCITMQSIHQLEYIEDWKRQNYTNYQYKKSHAVSWINLCFAALRAQDITKEEYKNICKQVSIREIISHKILTLKAIMVIFSKIFGLNQTKRLIKILYPYFYR